MNIRQVEEKTALQRANIRFYEQEGLLCPARKQNGYRDYSEGDVQLLLRIRLLRELGVSVEDIRRLCAGEQNLPALMEGHIRRLRAEQQARERAIDVCHAIRADNVSFDGLDAVRYLEREMPPAKAAPSAAGQDKVPFVPHPWKRHFARVLDLFLYGAAADVLLNGVFGWHVSLLDHLAPLVLMLLTEPVLLHYFGATLGKALLGIRVTGEDGGHLPIREGWVRTLKVLFYGMGLHVFPVSLICMYRARRHYLERECTSWDYRNEVHFVSRGRHAKWLCALGAAGVLILTLFCHRGAQLAIWLMPNRGNLTLSQFTENYNAVVRADAVTAGKRDLSLRMEDMLNGDGAYFTEDDLPNGTVVIDVMDSRPVSLSYTMADGFVQAVAFDVDMQVSGVLFDGYQAEMRRIVLALSDLSVFDGSIPRMLARTAQMGFTDHDFELYGVRVTCQCDWNEDAFAPFSQDGVKVAVGEDARFTVRFRAEKTKME